MDGKPDFADHLCPLAVWYEIYLHFLQSAGNADHAAPSYSMTTRNCFDQT